MSGGGEREEERVGRKWGAGHGKKFEFYFKGTREP